MRMLYPVMAVIWQWNTMKINHQEVIHVLHLGGKTRIATSMATDTASSGVGGGLMELEVLSMSGECMLTLNVADSVLGRELWKMILEKNPSKPGFQLVVSHTSRLVLNESLKQQGLGGELAHVSATYMPVNLLAALRFAYGDSVEDEEFSLNGIIEVTGVDEATFDLLQNLPKSLRSHLDICT